MNKSEESESCWRCCCPNKEKTKKMRQRRRSVGEAEETLQRLTKARIHEEETELKIEAKYLPLTFIPDFIIHEIFDDSFSTLPFMATSEVVLCVIDVSGFTSLCESYCAKGVSGIEELANVLNGYMSTLTAMILAEGGDILNFAGDAFLVQWSTKTTTIKKAVKQAYHCAWLLQTHKCLMTKNLHGTLKVKIGIALGEISMWVLGSQEFILFVAAGHVLPIVNKAESFCTAGETVLSQEVFNILLETNSNLYTTTELEDGYIKITDLDVPDDEDEPYPNRIELFEMCTQNNIGKARIFLIPGLRELKSAEELQYLSELTMVTILFIAMLKVNVAKPEILDDVFDIILESVKHYQGVLNKMLLFDKGCTFLVAFGLPGMKHSNDPVRGILCAEDIVKKLQNNNIEVSVGITSGTCFCGIVGHPQRQEYTGNRVNMAARIMVVYHDQPIAMNVDTYHLSRDEIGHQNFVELPARKMKGIDSAGAVYAYRKRKDSMPNCCESNFHSRREATTTFDFVEENFGGGEKGKNKIRHCIANLQDQKQRADMKVKTLLPVIIIQGQDSSGKSYLMFFAVDTALALGYKTIVSCMIPSCINEPFFAISRLIQRMLEMTMTESIYEREQKILAALSASHYHDLYLFNHLFDVHFPSPEKLSIDLSTSNEKFMELAKTIMCYFCEDHYTLIAVNNADHMDDQSWFLLHYLAAEKKVLIVLSLTFDFKEVNASASVMLLKAYLNVNMEAVQEDYFAPILCWFLGVQAVHKNLYAYLKEITDGKTHLLKEISLSPAMSECMNIVSLESIDKERLKKEFYIDQFESLNGDMPKACDLKFEVDLHSMMIPTNVNDAVKESLNNLTIQDRLLLKRASILGPDFDLHTLISISTGIKITDVLQSISSLISNNIFASLCTLEEILDKSDVQLESVTLEIQNTCFCFSVYRMTNLKEKDALNWPVGPYHRLKFRTHEFRTCIVTQMTKEQLYSMHMEVTGNLETHGPECTFCKMRRLMGYEMNKTKLYSEMSDLYKSIGMMFFPTYFKRKAAQAANCNKFPIQALNYIELAQRMSQKYENMKIADKYIEESFFDPLVLVVSLKKTKAESLLLLGDTYSAVAYAYQALEMLGLHNLCFHGLFPPQEFNNILPRFSLLHAESITKTVGFLSRAHLQAGNYKSAQDFVRIEYVALSLYPIDFLQIMNHMVTQYQCKYWLREREKLLELETNIFNLCNDKLKDLDALLDLAEINAIGCNYIIFIKINLVLKQFSHAEKIAFKAIEFLRSVNDIDILPKIQVLLCHIYYHSEQYTKCFEMLKELKDSVEVTKSQKYLALYNSTLAHLIMQSPKDVPKAKIYSRSCSKFASQWDINESLILSKNLSFYISVSMALWCLHCDENSECEKGTFKQCFKIAENLHKNMDKTRSDYWVMTGILFFVKIKLGCLKDNGDFVEDAVGIRKELNGIKHKIKDNFPVYLKMYEKLVIDIEDIEETIETDTK